jgi:threonine aldolase
MALRLSALSPFPLRHKVQANAVFVEMDEAALSRLHAAGWFAYRFLDGSVRFMCSWATTPESVDELGAILQSIA